MPENIKRAYRLILSHITVCQF